MAYRTLIGSVIDLILPTGAQTISATQDRCSLIGFSSNVDHDRPAKILTMRDEINKKTFRLRRLEHQAAAAKSQTETDSNPPLRNRSGHFGGGLPEAFGNAAVRGWNLFKKLDVLHARRNLAFVASPLSSGADV